MKLLLEKNIVFVEGDLNLQLMLDDEFIPEMKKPDNEQDYVLNVCIEKGSKIKSNTLVRNIQETLVDYFLNSNEHKKALYVSKDHEVSIYGEGYIDVFYKLKYAHPVLDDVYKTDDGFIGKNLMWIHLDESNEANDVIKIEFKSLFIVDELYHMQTLWEIGNGEVYKFLLKEISGIMQELNK